MHTQYLNKNENKSGSDIYIFVWLHEVSMNVVYLVVCGLCALRESSTKELSCCLVIFKGLPKWTEVKI